MGDTAGQIKKLYNIFSALPEEQFDLVYCERCLPLENSSLAFRDYLKRKLTLTDVNSVQLVAAQQGAGLTFELLKLKKDLEQENYIVAYCPLEKLINTADVHYVDIMLAMLNAVNDELTHKNIYYNCIALGNVNLSDLKDLIPFKGLDFKLKFSMLLDYVKNSDYIRSQIRTIFDKQALVFLDSCSKSFQTAEQAIKKAGYRGLVLIVDDFNKITSIIKQDYDVIDQLLIKYKNAFSCFGVDILLTMPLYKAFEDKNFEYKNIWGEDMILFSLPCIGENGCEPFDQLVSLLEKRVAIADVQAKAFAREDLKEFIKCSGANIAQIFELIREALLLTDDLPVKVDTVTQAIALTKSKLLRSLTDEDLDIINMLKSSLKPTDKEIFIRYIQKNYLFYCAQTPHRFILNPLLY